MPSFKRTITFETTQGLKKYARTVHTVHRPPPTTIQSLNTDILSYIFLNHFDDKEFLKLLLVCKQWRSAMEQKVFPTKIAETMPVRATNQNAYFKIKKDLNSAAKGIYQLLAKLTTQSKGWAEVLYYPDGSEKVVNASSSTGISSYFNKIKTTLNGNHELDILIHMQKLGIDLLQLGVFNQSFLHLFAFTNDINTLNFLKAARLDINAKDISFKVPPVVWRILGMPYGPKISFSFEILNLFIDEKTDVSYIFSPDVDMGELDEEYITDELPLLILRKQFELLETPTQQQEHFKCLALLANNYKDKDGQQFDFESPLINAGYTQNDVKCIIEELHHLRAQQVAQESTHNLSPSNCK